MLRRQTRDGILGKKKKNKDFVDMFIIKPLQQRVGEYGIYLQQLWYNQIWKYWLTESFNSFGVNPDVHVSTSHCRSVVPLIKDGERGATHGRTVDRSEPVRTEWRLHESLESTYKK